MGECGCICKKGSVGVWSGPEDGGGVQEDGGWGYASAWEHRLGGASVRALEGEEEGGGDLQVMGVFKGGLGGVTARS